MRIILLNILGTLLLPFGLFKIFLLWVITSIGNYNTRMGALLTLQWCWFAEITYLGKRHTDKSWRADQVVKLTAYLRLRTDDPQIWKRVKLKSPKEFDWAFLQCFGYFVLQGKYELAESSTGDWITHTQKVLNDRDDDFYAFIEKHGDDFSGSSRSLILEKIRLEKPEATKGWLGWMSSLENSKGDVFPYFEHYHSQMAQGIARWLTTQNPQQNKRLKPLIQEKFVVGIGGLILVYIDKSLALRLGMSEEAAEELHQSIVRKKSEKQQLHEPEA